MNKETWRHEETDIDMESWRHGNIDTWRHGHGDMEM